MAGPICMCGFVLTVYVCRVNWGVSCLLCFFFCLQGKHYLLRSFCIAQEDLVIGCVCNSSWGIRFPKTGAQSPFAALLCLLLTPITPTEDPDHTGRRGISSFSILMGMSGWFCFTTLTSLTQKKWEENLITNLTHVRHTSLLEKTWTGQSLCWFLFCNFSLSEQLPWLGILKRETVY